jgi:hypothetical protein
MQRKMDREDGSEGSSMVSSPLIEILPSFHLKILDRRTQE